jgi:hypothetical protein
MLTEENEECLRYQMPEEKEVDKFEFLVEG